MKKKVFDKDMRLKKVFDLWEAISFVKSSNHSLFIKTMKLTMMGLSVDEAENFIETYMYYNPNTKHKIVKGD